MVATHREIVDFPSNNLGSFGHGEIFSPIASLPLATALDSKQLLPIWAVNERGGYYDDISSFVPMRVTRGQRG